MNFHYTDGGRVDGGFETERRDCTVRALAAVTSISYAQAHEIFEQHGRRYGHRISFAAITHRTIGGYHFMRLEHGRLTLNQFLKQVDSTNRYVIRTRGHVFAVINGVVHDTFAVGEKSQVRAIWKVTI